MATLAPLFSTRNATSGGVIRKLTGIAMAPSSLMASHDSTYSGRLSMRMRTRSPNPTPRRDNASARACTRWCSSAQEMLCPR
ncbi:Uncharacterised protein [Mycobacteroides abscessus subsp. abscessus]|nr:Uncharacterised protein [Mycobacteroides abscessus subsp. abscessus]